ncbi:MAG: hypothetical protein D6680_16965 [Cyanobacteria bacterium J007]|nr:MAG: hypothetical protein D6680_16965 [Cyanobacteria bacterium J007]
MNQRQIMTYSINGSISKCCTCGHYQIEGRRGGACQLLGVPVKGNWQGCRLAIEPFAPSWEMPGEWKRMSCSPLKIPVFRSRDAIEV